MEDVRGIKMQMVYGKVKEDNKIKYDESLWHSHSFYRCRFQTFDCAELIHYNSIDY